MRTQNNYFTMPNEVFQLGLSAGELAVYSYLRRCEDRRTHQCWPSYRTIGSAVGMSENTVRKYVLALEERGLIVTEPTDVRLKSGRRRNGNLKYTLPSIQEVLRDYYARQRSTLEAQTERQRVQKMLAEQQAEDSCEPPVRPCVEWLGTQQGPSPSRGFWTNLGRFRGSAEDERKCWIKNRRHKRRSVRSFLPVARAITGVSVASKMESISGP